MMCTPYTPICMHAIEDLLGAQPSEVDEMLGDSMVYACYAIMYTNSTQVAHVPNTIQTT